MTVGGCLARFQLLEVVWQVLSLPFHPIKNIYLDFPTMIGMNEMSKQANLRNRTPTFLTSFESHFIQIALAHFTCLGLGFHFT